jgi:hypothetical protein
MEIRPWNVPIRADWYRSNDLLNLRFAANDLELWIREEHSAAIWVLSFQSVQAFRSTTEECAAPVIAGLPAQGGFFEVHGSPWLAELGKGTIPFLESSHHFIVCCYEEIVEAVATTCEFSLVAEER